jgi:hypothetical protein
VVRCDITDSFRSGVDLDLTTEAGGMLLGNHAGADGSEFDVSHLRTTDTLQTEGQGLTYPVNPPP